jgi:hypothetical protein
MPYRAGDYLTTALTDYNAQRLHVTLEDGGRATIGARRMERTASGSLLIRPRTWAVTLAANAIAGALEACFGKFADMHFPGWCVLPSDDGEEYWEFEWSNWAQTHEVAWKRPDGSQRSNREYWAQLATGLIGVRDRYDLSGEEIEERCRKAVAMGVAWCVLIDQEERRLSVSRAGRLERVESVEGWALREIPEMVWKLSWVDGNTGREGQI